MSNKQTVISTKRSLTVSVWKEAVRNVIPKAFFAWSRTSPSFLDHKFVLGLVVLNDGRVATHVIYHKLPDRNNNISYGEALLFADGTQKWVMSGSDEGEVLIFL